MTLSKAFVMSEVLKGKAGQPVTLPCPECEHPGLHDVNGDRQDPTMCCTQCGAHTDLSYFTVQLEAQ